MSRMEPLPEVFKERICFLVKERVRIGESVLPGLRPGDAPRIVYSCTRSSECAKLRLPCKILNQELSHYPFEMKFSLKLDRTSAGGAASDSPLPWKRRQRAR
jgi:hypothetical protein